MALNVLRTTYHFFPMSLIRSVRPTWSRFYFWQENHIILTFEEKKNYNNKRCILLLFYFIHEHRKRRDFLDSRPCNLSSSTYASQPVPTYVLYAFSLRHFIIDRHLCTDRVLLYVTILQLVIIIVSMRVQIGIRI